MKIKTSTVTAAAFVSTVAAAGPAAGQLLRGLESSMSMAAPLSMDFVAALSNGGSAKAGETTLLSNANKSGGKAKSKSNKSGKQEDPFNVEFDIEYIDCDYKLTFSFEHNSDLPSGSQEKCSPGTIAPDGLPYLAPREFPYKFSNKIYKETGFASLSLDWQACGHPPFGVFTIGHYDMHFYTDPIEVREKRTCDLVPQGPVCIPDAQDTTSGRAFFNVATILPTSSILANMPEKFTCDLETALPVSGIHCWDFSKNPAPSSWADPVLVMGSYDATVAFFEPMVPLSFVTGHTDHYYSEQVDYQGQTIKTLPSEYSINYEANTGRATITLKGARSSC